MIEELTKEERRELEELREFDKRDFKLASFLTAVLFTVFFTLCYLGYHLLK